MKLHIETKLVNFIYIFMKHASAKTWVHHMSVFITVVYCVESTKCDASEFFIMTSDIKKTESIILLAIKKCECIF